MKNVLKLLSLVILSLVIGYFVLGYLSSYFGWYGYKKWQYRVATSDINESKKRGVFVKELHFQIDSFKGDVHNFLPYIERGFKYGHHSSDETVFLQNSNYPYQLSFNFQTSAKMGLFIKESELKKFDSSNINRGYLKDPDLRDTIVINIIGENIHSGIIKVWQ